MKATSLQRNIDEGRQRDHFQPGSLSDSELLSQLLNPDELNNKDTQWAENLLRCFGGLRGLQIASRLLLDQRKGLDDRTARQIRLAHELVRRQLKQSLKRGVSLTSPAMTMEYLQTVLRDRNREIFTCLFLDTRNRVTFFEDLAFGLFVDRVIFAEEIGSESR